MLENELRYAVARIVRARLSCTGKRKRFGVSESMVKHSGIPVKGFKIRDGRLVKIHSYHQSASAVIRQKKSKRVKPARGVVR